MEMNITCINCPVGCRMKVTVENGVVTQLSGNSCKLGERYAHQEATMPERMVTAVVTVAGSDMPLSVKTRTPVPKKQIFEVMDAIEKIEVALPVKIGQIVLPDVASTGVDIIATKSLPA